MLLHFLARGQTETRMNCLSQEETKSFCYLRHQTALDKGGRTKDPRRRLDGERLAGFNQSADLSPLIPETFLSELPEPPLAVSPILGFS